MFAIYVLNISNLLTIQAESDQYVSATYSFMRVLLMGCLYVLWSSIVLNRKQLAIVNATLTAFLTWSTIVAILEYPTSILHTTLSARGGDISSRNGFEIFRSSGGIGGTVIEYAVVLVLMTNYLYLMSRWISHKILWPSMIFISLLMNFSRISFIISFILIIGSLIKKYKKKFVLTSAFVVVGAVLLLFYSGLHLKIIELYSVAVELSDHSRINAWLKAFDNQSIETVMFGRQMGINTGFYVGKAQKEIGDGFILSHFVDYGIVGTGLILAFMTNVIFRSIQDKFDRYITYVAVVGVMLINSAMEKVFILELFFFLMIAIRSVQVENTYYGEVRHSNSILQ